MASLLESPARVRVGRFAFKRFGVSVIGIVRKDANRIWSASDLRNREIRIAVVAGEVGEEIALERYDASPTNGRLIAVDTDDVPSIISQVEMGNADIALTTGPRWMQHLARCGTESTERVTIVFADKPLLLVPCGLLVASEHHKFADWLDSRAAPHWDRPEFQHMRQGIAHQYGGLVQEL